MAESITKQITEKLFIRKFVCNFMKQQIFPIAHNVCLFRNIDDKYEKGIHEQIYYFKECDTKTMGEEMFNLLNNNFRT